MEVRKALERIKARLLAEGYWQETLEELAIIEEFIDQTEQYVKVAEAEHEELMYLKGKSYNE